MMLPLHLSIQTPKSFMEMEYRVRDIDLRVLQNLVFGSEIRILVFFEIWKILSYKT